MAARFRVGVGGLWSDTAHWSLTSGGSGGASAPVLADDATLDSGCSGTVTVDVPLVTNSVTINNAAVALSLSATMTVTNAVTLTTGTLATNGFACVWGSYSSSNSNARTLTPGNSAISVSATGTSWNSGTITNLTVTANTATVTLTGSGSAATVGSISWQGMSFSFTGTGTSQITTSGNVATIGNLTYAPAVPAAGQTLIISGGTLTVSGTVTVTSSSRYYARVTHGGSLGIPNVLIAAAASLTCCTFADTCVGGAATWAGTLVGDAGGNQGITFTPSATQTYVGGTRSWTDPASWSGRRPLPQDDVVVSSAGGTLTVDDLDLGRSLDFTGYTGTLSLSVGAANYGNLKLAAGMTFSGVQTWSLRGRSASYTVTSNALAFPGPVALNAPLGTYTLADDLSCGANAFTNSAGTFVANGKNLSAANYTLAAATTTSMGNANTWTASGTGTVWSAAATSVVTAGTSTILLSSTSATARTFAGAGLTYGTLQFTATGSGALTITGNNTFSTLNLQCTTARTITLPASGVQRVTASFTRQGASGQLLSFVSSSPGTRTRIGLDAGATQTSAFNSLSGDVVVVTNVSATAATRYESTATRHQPRTLTVPTDEVASTMVSRLQGCMVACVQPAFNSTDAVATAIPVWGLDDGSTANRFEIQWVTGPFWAEIRNESGVPSTQLQQTDVFVSGARRILSMAWEPTQSYFSLSGAPYSSVVAAPPLSTPALRHLRIGAGFTGSGLRTFNGTILWMAFFSAKISDSEIAALQANYLNSPPDWSDLPGSPILLYTAATGYIVTNGVSTTREVAEALRAPAATSALEPVEAPRGIAATARDPLEAIGRASAAARDPLEALAALPARTVREPLEATASASRTAREPVEAIGVARALALEPVEAIGRARATAAEPVESTGRTKDDATLPFESSGVGRPGKAVGTTMPRSSIRSSKGD